jgi:hypothetical protein
MADITSAGKLTFTGGAFRNSHYGQIKKDRPKEGLYRTRGPTSGGAQMTYRPPPITTTPLSGSPPSPAALPDHHPATAALAKVAPQNHRPRSRHGPHHTDPWPALLAVGGHRRRSIASCARMTQEGNLPPPKASRALPTHSRR